MATFTSMSRQTFSSSSLESVASTKVASASSFSTFHSPHDLNSSATFNGFWIPRAPGPEAAQPASYMLDGPLTKPWTSYDDRLEGGAGADRVYGGDGHDTILGYGGNDQLFGGHGDDSIYVTSGTNYLYGGSGDDQIYGGSGTDFIFGGTNSGGYNGNNQTERDGDFLSGGAGNDYIYLDGFNAGQNSNTSGGGTYLAQGDLGNDNFIVGDINFARISGGSDSDHFIFTQGFRGTAEITDFGLGAIPGQERLVFDDAIVGDPVNYAGYVQFNLEAGGVVNVWGHTAQSLNGLIDLI